MKTNTNIWIGVGIIVLVVGAYIIGRNSTAPVSQHNVASSTVATTNTSVQTATPTISATPAIASNSQPCEQIAIEAAQKEQSNNTAKAAPSTTTVSDAYFSESYTGEVSDCFYELVTNYDNGTVVTAIHAAPNDEELGSCTEPYGQISKTTCVQDGSGSMSLSTFQLMEAKLFTD